MALIDTVPALQTALDVLNAAKAAFVQAQTVQQESQADYDTKRQAYEADKVAFEAQLA